MDEYVEGTYSQRNTGEACWSCAGLMTHAPGERCIYPDSHRATPNNSGETEVLRTVYAIDPATGQDTYMVRGTLRNAGDHDVLTIHVAVRAPAPTEHIVLNIGNSREV